jgi:hypothetical protein
VSRRPRSARSSGWADGSLILSMACPASSFARSERALEGCLAFSTLTVNPTSTKRRMASGRDILGSFFVIHASSTATSAGGTRTPMRMAPTGGRPILLFLISDGADFLICICYQKIKPRRSVNFQLTPLNPSTEYWFMAEAETSLPYSLSAFRTLLTRPLPIRLAMPPDFGRDQPLHHRAEMCQRFPTASRIDPTVGESC